MNSQGRCLTPESLLFRPTRFKYNSDNVPIETTIHKSGIREILKKYTRSISQKNITPHSARATVATKMASDKIDSLDAIQAMGWKSVDTYNHYIKRKDQKDLEKNLLSRLYYEKKITLKYSTDIN
jgi:integrase